MSRMVRIHWVSKTVSDIKVVHHNKNIRNVNLSILKILEG